MMMLSRRKVRLVLALLYKYVFLEGGAGMKLLQCCGDDKCLK